MKRLTIRRKKIYKRKERYTLIIMFFLIAPTVSIVFGKMVSERIIVPYINNAKGKSEESLNKNVDKNVEKITALSELNMYTIEVKEFINLDNAEDFLKILNSEGILGYVSKSSNYKVFTSITFDEKEVESQLTNIKEKYPDSKIKSIQVQGKQLDINSSDKDEFKNLISTINLINNIYKEELSMWGKSISATNYEEIKINMNKNNIEIEKSMKRYSDKVESDDLKTFYSMMKVNIDNRKKIIDEFDTKNSESIKKTYFNLIKNLFSYINYYKL